MPLKGSTVLASFDDGSPALFEKVYGTGRVLCFTSTIDREWTNLPIHGVYLPFLYETIKYLALKQTDEKADYHIGDLVELGGYQLPPGTEVAIFNPMGEETRTEINESSGIIYDATEHPGIYSVPHISGKQPRYFVVNPDTIESNPAARDPEELTSMLTGGEKAVPAEVVTAEMITKYHGEVEKNQGVLVVFDAWGVSVGGRGNVYRESDLKTIPRRLRRKAICQIANRKPHPLQQCGSSTL